MEEEEEEDEELEGWPFPAGDPFDPQQPQPARRPAPTDSMPPATEDAQTLQAEIERQARAAEKRAQAQEAEARARARQAREVRPARRLAALIGWEVESRPPPSSIAAEQSMQVRRLTEFTRRGFVVRRKGLRLLDLGSATHVTEQAGDCVDYWN